MNRAPSLLPQRGVIGLPDGLFHQKGGVPIRGRGSPLRMGYHSLPWGE